MSLTNPNSVVTEERLSDFYQGILPYLGGMPDILANKFNKSDLYSTDEKIIGQWIDGRPIYQKTITFSNLTNNSNNKISSDIQISTHKIIDAFGIGNLNDGVNDIYIPYVAGTTVSQRASIFLSDGLYIFIAGLTVASGYLTVSYTKTTDSPIAIGIDTDYSTTEKIVGTWIDGKPIYQKTVTIDNIPTTSSTEKVVTKAHGISNLNAVVNIGGVWKYASGSTVQFGDLSCVNSSNLMFVVQADTTNVTLRIKKFDGASFTVSGTTATITIQYTKTS